MMFDLQLHAFAYILLFALTGWVLALLTDHYSHVDFMWALFFLISAAHAFSQVADPTLSQLLALSLVFIWAIRLSIYIAWRNGGVEDKRYQVIKSNNQPYFRLKSFYIVFFFQAALAWLIAYPLYIALITPQTFTALNLVGLGLVFIGFLLEVVADFQLLLFKSHADHQRSVLSTGVWRYSRHPNYFGECLIWWGFYLCAASVGAWWTIFSPLMMTLLLLKISGVALLESTIIDRRPEYKEYVLKTNAFIPWWPKK